MEKPGGFMTRENFTPKVKREITNYSDGVCMLCLKGLTSPKIAHIIPAAAKGPRSEFRDMYEDNFIKSSNNGLCLCSECHDLIDDDGLNNYSLEELIEVNKKFKEEYFIKAEYKHLLGIGDINYSNELSKFYDHLKSLLNTSDAEIVLSKNDSEFTKISIDEKIEKNNLYFVQARMIKSNYAFEFMIFKEVMENSLIISEKIRAAIKILYQRLKKNEQNISNANLFDKMLTLMYDPSSQVVGNKIPLIYFFIICEVFSI